MANNIKNYATGGSASAYLGFDNEKRAGIHILSANMYELEILRLLYKFAPKNEIVENMISKTLERLKTTCFGCCDDGVGECFDTSLIVLRFISTVAPQETE